MTPGWCFAAAAISVVLFVQAQPVGAAPVDVQWLGQACFLVQGGGRRVLVDPVPPTLGYPSHPVVADVVLVSHGHFDHAYVELAQGQPPVLRQAGTHEAAGLTFHALTAPHWEAEADQGRGEVLLFTWEQGGVRFCHLGDLGRALEPAQVKALGRVDVLFVPVGGFYTIGPEQAVATIRELQPKIAVPMHYRTAVLTAQLASKLRPVDDFLAAAPTEWKVRRPDGPQADVSALPSQTEVWVLPYPHQ